ncbi:2-dehydropantoate 2-reductase [Sulfitobacter mediterraneus]|uniref:2-dehydropantoate 2-reductase n=1 Tax=Sulfitobacter mediterraneus TaxID=83219 RepID=UPI0019334685|nr:2-dehydropantoate 2-reductase [Sulfitobacter mediterraneus]MBM1633853.1 2-dehydropantoate 2-reductase [Sulfitobacter mediterraneus]MBM1641632.1 2-dehydropantoate 2-reductase [Sulfitobacter mediterraneus]MBM1645717.1 2-dehydropantoate 2-reductase [Sulfitobacter mediterraneus]MBM1649751.1 2-dehydropantoate 2-reductase [Sulfitobacter mediterraneus]MBM1653786.1 2-dehydropantoate 2-reductase [Sulfitobacter mediterraneus]
MAAEPRIVIAGAGAIGCFVGGLLAAGGRRVTLLVRPRVAQEIRSHGLTLTDFGGMAIQIGADRLALSEDPACLSKADVVLVTVKSGDTAAIAELIDQLAPIKAPVISLQNGLRNGALLQEVLPGRDVRGGMVPFNVVPMGQGCYHRATSGDVVIAGGAGDLDGLLSVPHLSTTSSRDIEAVQWGKFLINLNNALNALSGLPLAEQLRDRAWRRLMADQWQEALGILRGAGIRPVSTTPVSVGMIPFILRLPTPLFSRIAASMLTIDAQARTSMALDLMAGRPTEIDSLQGAVIAMAQAQGRPAPICTMVAEVIRTAELAAEGLPDLSATALRREIRQAAS